LDGPFEGLLGSRITRFEDAIIDDVEVEPEEGAGSVPL
jgi:hypothetical protein